MGFIELMAGAESSMWWININNIHLYINNELR